jgi:uncharacterized protein (TIGR02453 family)
MKFDGWPEAGLDWLEDIVDHNERAWFVAHKATYERSVRGPLEALLADVAAEFGPAKVFRPHRDVRFAKDKRPYKENVAGVINGARGGGWYVALAADGLTVASGWYWMSADQLQRYRAAVDAPAGQGLETAAARLRGAGFEVGGESLKTAPRGWPRDHPRIDLLRLKGVTVGRRFPPAKWFSTPRAEQEVLKAWRRAAPVNDWLAEHVGPAESTE